MWKVTRKGLAAHKLRFLLTAVAVLLGVAFISGTFVFTATIQQTFDDLFANIYRGTDAQVRGQEVLKNDNGFGPADRPRVPASLERIVQGAPGVEAAAGNVQLNYAQIVKANGKAVGTPGQGAPTLGFGWNPVPRLNQFHLTAGGHAPENSAEIVIDKGTADKGDFHVGQLATVLTSKAPKEYTIVGIARFGTADNLAGASVVLFTRAEAQRIAGAKHQYSYISIAAKPGVSQTQVADNVRTALAEQHAPSVEVVTGAKLVKENQDAIQNVLGFLNTGLLIFGIVALAVGAFIIYNTFSIIVAQRTREMALLRAIGASRGQVLASIVGESVVVGIVASAIGVVAGIGLAIGLKALMSAIGIDIPGSGAVVPAKAIIIGMSVGIFITLVSSLIPARNGARVPPVAAMRDVSIERPIARAAHPHRGRPLGAGRRGASVRPLRWCRDLARRRGCGADLRGSVRSRAALPRGVSLTLGRPIASRAASPGSWHARTRRAARVVPPRRLRR